MADDRLVGGVVAVAAVGRASEVEDGLDAPSHAARRYRLVGNQRFEGLEHQPAVDRRNGKIAEHRIGILGKRRQPLLAVLGVAPFARVYGEVVLGALPERHLLGLLGPRGEHGAVAALTTNAAYKGCRKLVPGAHRLPLALSRFKTMDPEDARGGMRTTQAKKNK